ncbi:MAG: hypothetical protein ACRYGR_08625 [Janthinobacterium lividum]
MSWMTADDFQAALGRLGLSQAGFARKLRELGDPRPEASILRSISSYWTGSYKVPGELHVILRTLEAPAAAPRGLADIARELQAIARQQGSDGPPHG